MASVTKISGNLRAVQFYGHDGIRRTIRLGEMKKRDADAVRVHVEEMLSATLIGRPLHHETETWLNGIADSLYDKFLKFGLVDARQANTAGLAATLDAMIVRRTDWKLAQRRAMTTTRKRLVDMFGADRRVRSITVADAKDFRRSLLSPTKENAKKLSPATVSKMVKNARAFFADMMERRIVRENVFMKVETGSQENTARLFFVERETVARLLAACKHQEWRVIIALARYAGLRTPSETLLLRWKDIDWTGDRFRITSPKTAGSGKGERWCPLFPEIRDELLKHRGGAADEDHIIELFRYTARGFRDNLQEIMKAARVEPWPKLWQNMRSTCATELIENREPATLVAQWIGNTPGVLLKHYTQLRGEQYRRAAKSAATTFRHELTSNDRTPFSGPKSGNDMVLHSVPVDLMGPLGLGSSPRIAVKSRVVRSRAAKSAARRDPKNEAPILRRMGAFSRLMGSARPRLQGEA